MGRRLSAAAVAALLAVAPASAEPVTADRIGIVDGDTVTIDGESWRLMGYDTPEGEHAWCEAERRLSAKATARLGEIIAAAGRIEAVTDGARDRYKRVLGRLLVDGRDVAEIMIGEDWARPYAGGRKKGWCSRDSRDDLVPP